MRALRRISRLCGNLLRRERVEGSLDAELRAYVDEVTERNAAQGMSRQEARRQALLEAGGLAQIEEDVRERWLGHGIETTLQDIRYGGRALRRSPAFTVVVVATLALGIGANLTMFSLLRAVLWKPLPYPEADRIVTIQVDARNRPNAGATPGEVLDLKERSRSFEQVAMFDFVEADLAYQGEKEHVAAISVSDDLLPLLGARPVRGRPLDARRDLGTEHALAILISDELWRRRFAGDPGVIGKAVRINDAALQIAGVLPPGFRLFLPPSAGGAEQIDVWLPAALSHVRQYRGIPVLARLRPGVTVQQANAELETLAAQFERERPEFYSGDKGWQASPSDRGPGPKVRLTARLLHDEMTREARPALFLLSGAVGFVLLIACVDVAGLMLARGAAQRRELEIRRALGAGRARIVRQLLTESLLLAGAAAVLGLGGAWFGLEAIGRLSASRIPLQSRAGIDATVMLWALALAMGTSLLFGLWPAWRLATGAAAQPLRAGRTETPGTGIRRLHRALVIAEVALSIVPLACGGLMLRSFLNLLNAPLGFNPANVVTARAAFDLGRYPNTKQQWALLRDVLERVRALPGVDAASAASPLPLEPNQQMRRVGRVDQPEAPPMLATQQGAWPGYLAAMGTPLLAGRDFTDGDVAGERQVTIVDERLAKRLWPDGAIGKRLAVYRTGWRSDLEVVGVTAPVRATRVRDANVPHFIMPSVELSLVIRTRATAAQLTPGIQAALDAAPGVRAAFAVRPMSDYVADSVGDTRFILFVLAAFAGASVVLAAMGLYGTLLYLTAQRTREFGVRLALGASAQALVAIVIRESVWLTAAGAAVGLAGAGVAARAMQGLLYGVEPLDSITLACVVALVGAVALGAAGVPAWRAARIDPQTSLRA